MANLTVPQLIKILLGIFVVVVVVIGIFLFFRGTVIDFFKNLPGGGVDEDVQGELTEGDFTFLGHVYTIRSQVFITRDDGKQYRYDTDYCDNTGSNWYWDYDEGGFSVDGQFGDAEETAVSNGVPICMSMSFVDAMNTVELSEGEDFFVGDDEEILVEYETREACESSGCADRNAINLFCSGGDLRGDFYRCNRKGECVVKRLSNKVMDCAYGCTGEECDTCLFEGTEVKGIGNPHRSNCCNGYSCLERGFLRIRCTEFRCN